jgi:hypothetical protein
MRGRTLGLAAAAVAGAAVAGAAAAAAAAANQLLAASAHVNPGGMANLPMLGR